MKTDCTHSDASEARLLARSCAARGGLFVEYRLEQTVSATESGYYLTLFGAGDFGRISVGEDLLFAVECYRTAVQGCVTPCAIADIVSDLRFLHTGI